jgi:pyridinium-3,5-bisthiocarboxylic acid mononucleotide nickel chelatase
MVSAYFDCFSGIAGDMVLGALIDLGCDVGILENELKKLGISGYTIDVKKIMKKDILATDISITVEKDQPYRTFSDISMMISQSELYQPTKEMGNQIFIRLAEAEGKVHNIPIEKVHFHEVGAVDSIIDIIGSVICLKMLKIDEVYASPLPLGSGFVDCQHGRIPVPAPATVELVKDVPTYQLDSGHEMVTPTGAAIITTIAKGFGENPLINIENIGYGSGKIKSNLPGVLRVMLGTTE